MMRIALIAASLSAAAAALPPISHVHLALSSDPTAMHVQWTTNDARASENVVSYGASAGALSNTANGASWSFTDGGRTYNLHRATMTGLTPGATVFYAVGGPSGVSTTSQFVATRTNYTVDPLVIAWIGDLGYANAQADSYLQAEVLAGVYDHVVHVGDFACVRVRGAVERGRRGAHGRGCARRLRVATPSACAR